MLANPKTTTSHMNRILCHQCGVNSIPAPPGATEKTRFICPDCSDVGAGHGEPEAGETAQLDRCQFDDFKIRPDQSEFPANVLKAAAKTSWAVAKADLSILSDQQQIVFFMRFWLGMNPEQISKSIGITKDTIKAQLYRAKRKMGYKSA